MSFEQQRHYTGNNGPGMAPPAQMGGPTNIVVDLSEFKRTRDALAAAYFNLSASFQNAISAYLAHTEAVLAGDAALNIGHLRGAIPDPAQIAAMALQQNGGGALQTDIKPEVDEKKRKKRSYKPRDPNAPKRPLTAYFRYLGDVRGSISEDLQKNPDKYKDIAGQPGDISRIATQRWSQMTEEEKEPYKRAYQEELKDYTVKAEEYNKAKGLPFDATAEGDITSFTNVEEDAPVEPPAVFGAVQKVDNRVEEDDDDDDDDDSDDDSDTSSDDSDDEPPPPPPKAATPKKSAMKKNKTPASSVPQQTFSSIPAPTFNSVNDAPAPSSSPSRKRKIDNSEGDASKKRGRKATGSEPTPAASSPEASGKKEKKKRKGKGDA